MRSRRARSWAFAGLLVACTGPAPQPPAAAPPPLSPEQQRFEQWKEGSPGGDPNASFSRAAEQEAERRRREALQKGERLREAQPATDGGGEAPSSEPR